MKNKKPSIKTLIEIFSDIDKLNVFIKKYLSKDAEEWEDLAIYAEQYIQSLDWTNNEICDLLKILDHNKLARYMVALKDDAPPEKIITKATMCYYGELLNFIVTEDRETFQPWNIEDYFSKKEIENRNLICDLLKKLNHADVAKRIIYLQTKPVRHSFKKAVLDIHKKG